MLAPNLVPRTDRRAEREAPRPTTETVTRASANDPTGHGGGHYQVDRSADGGHVMSVGEELAFAAVLGAATATQRLRVDAGFA